ncbi:MAG: electron transfer flavoprotein, partial [Acidimicrobiales bacterium]
REAVRSEMNAFDGRALAWARALRRGGEGRPGGDRPDQVVAFTMGPPQAAEVLESALALGADRAVHLVDMRFAGADTLATARALAQLCRREEPDLVLLGRIATDGGTAQVAPQMAELAGLPVVTEAVAIELAGDRLAIRRQAAGSLERWLVPLPAVVSIDGLPEPGWEDGPATDPGREPAGAVEILDADALGGDGAGYGIRGSATYVQRIDPAPPRPTRRVVTDPSTCAEILASLAATPADAGPARPVPPAPIAAPTAAAPAGRRAGREIWALVEGDGTGDLHRLAAEAIACAAQVAGPLRAQVVSVLLGEPGPGTVDRLGAAGADRILVARSCRLAAARSTEAEVDALAAMVATRSPVAVVGPWTTGGRQLVPRVAARLGMGCTGDMVGLDTSPRPGAEGAVDPVWLKPAWNGTVVARVVARSPVAMGTLRPGGVRPLVPTPERRAPVEVVDVDVDDRGRHATAPVLAGSSPLPGHSPALDDASVVVCVGRRAAASLPALATAIVLAYIPR